MKWIVQLIIITLLFKVESSFSQKARPLLERIISIAVKNEPTKSVLDQIAVQGNFTFSYPSGLIDPNKKVTITAQKKTIREVLPLLFGDAVTYKAKGNYLILTAAKKKESPGPASVFILNGYVIDEVSGEKIPSVSIYEATGMISTITNKYGYFSIKLDDPKIQLRLKVSKQNYRDTLITITNKGNQTLAIAIKPAAETTVQDSAALASIPAMDFLVPEESAVNTENIKDTLYKEFQLSFLPVLGTNYKLSGNVINDYSLNILGGYSLGTNKAEFAGLFNINRGNVKYVQGAGFANAVGGNFEGVQLAGYLNMVRKTLYGIQLSGFGNLVWDTTYAIQAAGFFNFNRGISTSIQVAGFTNINLDTTKGIQVSGFLNAGLKPYRGFQLAGFTNAAIQEMEGAQLAGFGNLTVKNFKGLQMAGICNVVVKECKGTQIAGFLNYARTIKGSQFGLINISDSCTGVPVGLISYVHSGYHRLEISADEVFFINAALRTGTRSFHNLLFSGIQPEKTDTNLWTFGYGLGTSIVLGKTTLLDLDLSCQQINYGEVGPKINLLSKFSVGIEQRIANGVHLSTGPVLSAQLTNNYYAAYPDIFGAFTPHIFYKDQVNTSNTLRMWLGWKFGLRFF